MMYITPDAIRAMCIKDKYPCTRGVGHWVPRAELMEQQCFLLKKLPKYAATNAPCGVNFCKYIFFFKFAISGWIKKNISLNHYSSTWHISKSINRTFILSMTSVILIIYIRQNGSRNRSHVFVKLMSVECHIGSHKHLGNTRRRKNDNIIWLILIVLIRLNSLLLGETIWMLVNMVEVMAWCLTAPSHYPTQCWPVKLWSTISNVPFEEVKNKPAITRCQYNKTLHTSQLWLTQFCGLCFTFLICTIYHIYCYLKIHAAINIIKQWIAVHHYLDESSHP